MLILSRRVGERLMIGDEITIEFLGFSGNQVRVGIRAPKNIKILREELLERSEQQSTATYERTP